MIYFSTSGNADLIYKEGGKVMNVAFSSAFSIRRIFKIFNLLFALLLVAMFAKTFEFEFCDIDLSSINNTAISSKASLKIRANDNSKASEATNNPIENHSRGHHNHICKLIVCTENAFKFSFGDMGPHETRIFPPEDLFLEGPFKPPKYAA